jgi:hypothetical protein
MAAPYSQFTTYQFGTSATFNRLVQGDQYPEWFQAKQNYTQDYGLRGSRDFLDLGALTFDQLPMIAVFASSEEREDMITRIGAEATLVNSRGFSETAVLISAGRVYVNAPGLWGLQVTFIRRPA